MKIIGWILIVIGGLGTFDFLGGLFVDISVYPSTYPYPFKEVMITGNALGMRVFPIEVLLSFIGILVLGIYLRKRARSS